MLDERDGIEERCDGIIPRQTKEMSPYRLLFASEFPSLTAAAAASKQILQAENGAPEASRAVALRALATERLPLL
jgi:hypothetical protein